MHKLSLTVLTLAAIAVAITVSSADTAPLATFGKKVSIGTVPDLALSPIQKEGLRGFRNMKAYFGALYVSRDGTSYQHFVNWHDLDKVKVAARKGCEIASLGNPCVLAAVSVPKGMDPNGENARGLGSWAQRDLAVYRKRQVDGRYGAFAVSGSAHQGFSNDWVNEAEARDTALAFCEAAVANDLTTLGIEGRAFARAQGYDTCEIIEATGPTHDN
jgi:hypothetical protein